MYEEDIWRDKSTQTILKSVVVGHFAMWVVRQSPYLFPEHLDDGIEEFNKNLISNFKVGDVDFLETTYIAVRENIKAAISNSDTISSWSVAKEGAGPAFVSAYSHPKKEYDFIDLDALARNISQSVWLELGYRMKVKMNKKDNNTTK